MLVFALLVNGGYSEWTVFTECTKTCGTGTRFRTRTCDNPSPRFGGFNCGGEDSQTFKCNILPCPSKLTFLPCPPKKIKIQNVIVCFEENGVGW